MRLDCLVCFSILLYTPNWRQHCTTGSVECCLHNVADILVFLRFRHAEGLTLCDVRQTLPEKRSTAYKQVDYGGYPTKIFFTVFWLLGSWLFSIYINNFGSYNKVYGSIAAFAILMIWLYFTSIIILIGGEINNYVYEKIHIKTNNQLKLD